MVPEKRFFNGSSCVGLLVGLYVIQRRRYFGTGGGGRSCCFIAVSYTHLDVYKRQFFIKSKARSSLSSSQIEIPILPPIALVNAVSYTHLDVYKRQAQTGPAVSYDENVMSNHLAMLVDSPALQEIRCV